MAYLTLQQLATEVQTAIYQAAGSSVQIYSQDVIAQAVQHAFDHIFMEDWWPQFVVREVRTLNQVNGRPTALLTSIKQYDDIRFVYPADSQRPLPVLSPAINPLGTYLAEGTTPRYVAADLQTIFRVWPDNAEGDVLVVGRARPDKFILTDTVPFDSTLLTHFAAWSYFTDDGSNPEAALKHKMLFEQRYMQIRKSSFNESVILDPFMDRIPNQWQEGRPF